MNDRAALELALAANPDDFATHAAYADLLAEQGDPRGDYIRLQLALEDRQQPVERLRAMEQEAFELSQRHEAEWLGPLAEHVRPSAGGLRSDVNIDVLEANVQVTYRRGWIDTVRVRELSPAVTAALADCPIVRLLAELEVVSESLADLIPLPIRNLSRLRWEEEQRFTFDLDGDDAGEPAEAETLPPDGWFHPVNPSSASVPFVVREALSLLVIPRLRELALRFTNGNDAIVRLLIDAGLLDQLRGLDLRGCGITDDGAQALAAHPAVPKLDYLHLDDNHISPVGIDALAAVGVAISQRQHLGPTPDLDADDGEIAF